METSLHKQLKVLYADGDAQTEVPFEGYRIDVVADGELVEIQQSALAAIRDKIRKLLENHRVLVVKPLVAEKRLIKRESKDGPVVDRRLSPKRGTILDVFEELVHFTKVFPHPRLALEVLLVDVEEWRYPGHGRRRRRRERDHITEDLKLIKVHEIRRFRTAEDLLTILPASELPTPFHTGHLAAALGVQRWIAQRITYCLRKMGAAKQVGKAGNALLYELTRTSPKPRRRRKAG